MAALPSSVARSSTIHPCRRARHWYSVTMDTGRRFRKCISHGPAFPCAAVAGCIIVAGGQSSGGHRSKSVEVYDEASNQWTQLHAV
mmetsp:Transcript_9365/g.14907  ORF Transcript_9365/g.14907 Transcript_9365/m.14907 type:complete len:86 (+) Transcript_9365:52-309(+)